MANRPALHTQASIIEIKDGKIKPTPTLYRPLESFHINNKEYFRSELNCLDKIKFPCRCCFPYVKYVSAESDKKYQDEFKFQSSCCCLPCCFPLKFFKNDKYLGEYAEPCCSCDQNCCYMLCPFFYCGRVMTGKFLDRNGKMRFVTAAERNCFLCEIIQYVCSSCDVCRATSCCACCITRPFAISRQPIYRNLNDKTPVAHFEVVTHTDCGSIKPLSAALDPVARKQMSQSEIDLLSQFLVVYSDSLSGAGSCASYHFSSSATYPTGLRCCDQFNGVETLYYEENQARKRLDVMK